MKFEELSLAPELLRAVEELGFVEATPIQAMAIPEALAGKRFYEPKDVGFEAEIRERLERMRKAREGK